MNTVIAIARLQLRQKSIFLFIALCLSSVSFSQVFWTEDFNNGCANACPAPGYTGPNGAWTETILFAQGNTPNAWFVSCAENNTGIGNCSSGCVGGGNATLHISAAIGNVICPNDCGAAYDAGGLCGILSCPLTNRRIESPTINCTGQTGIVLNYSFLHTGTPGTDFASIWYFNGTLWNNLGAVPQSNNAGCGGQGKWTAGTINLPNSANNNPNVRIGFSWQNNDDGAGTDPSVAIDDITLSMPVIVTPITFTVTLPSPVCQTSTLSATYSSTSTPTTFTWTANSPDVVFTPVNTGTTTLSFNAPGVYSVTLAACQGTNCSTSTSTIQVIPTPTLSITATPTAICSSGTSTLSTNGPAIASYTWVASTGTNPVGTTSVVVNPTTTTSYTVTAGLSGCSSSATITVPVTNAPTVTVTPNSSICTGQSISLNAGGAVSYTWSPSATLSSSVGAAVTASPATTTTYTVTGSDGTCTNTASVTITVGSAPSITITPQSQTICTGETATITAAGGSTYTWTASSGSNPAGSATVTTSPTITTTYTITTGVPTCSASTTATVNVTAIPTLTVSPLSTTICAGQSATLTASGGSTYTWTASSGTNPPNNASVTVTPGTNTTYTVLTGTGTCTASAISSVDVAPALNTSIAAGSTTVCLTKTVSLTANAIGTTLTYTWQPVSAIQGANNTASVVAKPTSTATVVYSVTVSNGICSETATLSLQTFNCIPPVSSFTNLTNDSICSKGCITFMATSTGPQPMTYEWYFPGATPPTSNLINPEACYSAAGNYTVVLITHNTFGTDTLIQSDFVNVADTPSVVKAFGDTLVLVGQTAPIWVTGDGTSWHWSPDNGSIACPTCSNTIVQPTVTTQYIVTAYNSPYCKKQDTIVVRIDFTCGDFFVPNVFSPNDDGLNDFVNVHGFCISTFNMQIFSRWGEKVFETNSKDRSWDGKWKGKPMDTGVFVYKVDGVTIDGKPFMVKGNITLLR